MRVAHLDFIRQLLCITGSSLEDLCNDSTYGTDESVVQTSVTGTLNLMTGRTVALKRIGSQAMLKHMTNFWSCHP
jgi:hypothetical protein